MVTLGNEPNTWSELEQQEGNMDEEAETCVGVRSISTCCCERVITLTNFRSFENLGRRRQTEHPPHQLPPHIETGGPTARTVYP